MLKTIIDFEIIEQFLSLKQPDRRDPIYHTYSTFWKFIKEECYLEIFNFDKTRNSNFISELTTGRGNAELSIKEEYKEPYKCEIKVIDPFSNFGLVENHEEKRKKYEKLNGLLISFQDDYLDKWERISLSKIPDSLPVRKYFDGIKFKSWEQLGDYLLPFTDVVISDNYLLSDDSLIESNLMPILLQLNKATTVRYNLTIVTIEGEKYKLDGEKVFKKLLSFKLENQLNCELSLVINKGYELGEHDRGIFMNYLRIYSGDSFNYFNSKKEIITKGTDIQFKSMAFPANFNTANAALENISAIVKKMKCAFPTTHTFGTLKNRLLN